MKRRRLLAACCLPCAGGWSAIAHAQSAESPAAPAAPAWVAPPRFAKPDLAGDEGGLWALMDREETRLRRSPFLLRDDALQDHVQKVACKLAGSHCEDVRVYLVRTPFFNASMAPNGMLQVWSGLLLRVENEAQLAAVLGHEIGHYVQRHTLERLRDARARSAFATFMGAFGLVGLMSQLATMASLFAFSREQEREADSIGLALMRDAGYDPREAGKVWDNLRAEASAGPGGDPSRSSPLFATHPASDERSRRLAQLAAGATEGYVGEDAYAARVAALRFGFLEDELKRGQYAQSLVLLDRLLRRMPDQPALLYFRGETRRLRGGDGDADAAFADLRRAAEIGNEPAQVHRSLGYLHRQLARTAEASAEFARYVELAPNAPDVEFVRTYITEGKS